MTFGYAEEKVNDYIITIEQEKFSNAFKVCAYPIINESENLAGFPETELYYGTMQEAKRRFSYLKSKIKRDGYACSR